MFRKLLFATILLLASFTTYGQQHSGGVKGTIISRADRSPITNAQIVLKLNSEEIAIAMTDNQGRFSIENLPDGIYELNIKATDYIDSKVNVTIEKGYVVNLFNISLSPKAIIDNEEEGAAEFDLEDSGYSDNPTIILGQSDVFNEITGYNFSAVRFKTRGLNGEAQTISLAGVNMNDAITGYSPHTLWSGLNEVTRTKFSVNSLEISDYGFGGYNGLVNIPANATNIRKGWRASLLTNSVLYRLRAMLTYSSGQLDNGWSYAFSVSTRLGGNDWVEGVYYQSWGYYGSIEKRFGDKHKIGATFFATPRRKGAQNASTQEVYDLLKDNMYNSNWGYQDGKIRNSRERIIHEPIAILKYDYTPSYKFNLSATALYRFGKNGYTALDWYDAFDPRPDYYRNLPSYFYMSNSDYNRNNYTKYLWAKEAWQKELRDYVHVNWDKLYNVNYNNIDKYGKRSKYIVEERRVDQNDINFATNFKWRISNPFTLTGGASYKWNRTDHYKKVHDLLGGDYFVNIDNFAERDYAASEAFYQNDLNYFLNNGEAQVLHKGDKFGYFYYAHVRNLEGWLNLKYAKGGFEAQLAGKVAYTKFWREGLYRKGLFAGLNDLGEDIYYNGVLITTYDEDGNPITSYGKSKKIDFTLYSTKANLSYSFLGGHKVSASAGFFQDAPKFNKAFVSPRTRNTIIPYLEKTKIYSADLNYDYNNNGITLRLSGFFTQIEDQTDVMSFYDDSQNSFTNFAMRGIDQRHIGIEFGIKLPTPIQNLTFEGAFTFGEYTYISNPKMTQTMDNSTQTIYKDALVPYWMSHPIFAKDDDGNYMLDDKGDYIVKKFKKHYIAGTPQLAMSLGLSYFYNYWFIDLNANYFDRTYLSMNPLYRTDMATSGPDGIVTPAEIEYMTPQEKFKSAWILNFSLGKSWYIKRTYQLGFSFNLNNILNNKNIKTGGYEQTRFVDNTVSKERYYRFDPKYYYMNGISYLLNIYFRF